MEKKNSGTYAINFFGAMFIVCMIVSIPTVLAKPDFASGDAYFYGSISLMAIAAVIGGLLDLSIASRQRAAIPKKFVNFLAEHLGEETCFSLSTYLTILANKCVSACENAIEFQKEELKGTGRASVHSSPENIAIAKAIVEARVKEALADFYSAYDTLAPLAVKFLFTMGERSFKTYASSTTQAR